MDRQTDTSLHDDDGDDDYSEGEIYRYADTSGMAGADDEPGNAWYIDTLKGRYDSDFNACQCTIYIYAACIHCINKCMHCSMVFVFEIRLVSFCHRKPPWHSGSATGFVNLIPHFRSVLM